MQNPKREENPTDHSRLKGGGSHRGLEKIPRGEETWSRASSGSGGSPARTSLAEKEMISYSHSNNITCSAELIMQIWRIAAEAIAQRSAADVDGAR